MCVYQSQQNKNISILFFTVHYHRPARLPPVLDIHSWFVLFKGAITIPVFWKVRIYTYSPRHTRPNITRFLPFRDHRYDQLVLLKFPQILELSLRVHS